MSRHSPSTVEQGVRDQIGSLDNWLTRSALRLARLIDQGEQVASATRELRAVMALIEDPTPKGDAVDDLEARRAARRKSA